MAQATATANKQAPRSFLYNQPRCCHLQTQTLRSSNTCKRTDRPSTVNDGNALPMGANCVQHTRMAGGIKQQNTGRQEKTKAPPQNKLDQIVPQHINPSQVEAKIQHTYQIAGWVAYILWHDVHWYDEGLAQRAIVHR